MHVAQLTATRQVGLNIREIEYWVYGDLILIYPKPYSIHQSGTIRQGIEKMNKDLPIIPRACSLVVVPASYWVELAKMQVFGSHRPN